MVFPPQRGFGFPATFDCNHCQTCQEMWVDHEQVRLSSGKGSINTAHAAMHQLLTKLLLVKTSNTFMIHYVLQLCFQNTIVIVHRISVSDGKGEICAI